MWQGHEKGQIWCYLSGKAATSSGAEKTGVFSTSPGASRKEFGLMSGQWEPRRKISQACLKGESAGFGTFTPLAFGHSWQANCIIS